MSRISFILIFFFVCRFVWAETPNRTATELQMNLSPVPRSACPDKSGLDGIRIPSDPPSLVPALDSASQFKRKKRIAALFAFPLPFGIIGVHRIVLGTKPYIPFVYIGTAGGCVGILPLIDFIAILRAKPETFKRFENNPKVFIWGR